MNSETQAGTPPRIPIETVLKRFPETAAEEWSQHENGGGWKHRAANVTSRCFVGNALLRRGVFHGGVFRGGVFRGGVFYKGFFWDGEYLGGEFTDGEYLGGEFTGGVFHGGRFIDGEYRGGVFYNGFFRDGVFTGGEWTKSPLFIEGSRYALVQCGAGDSIQIGCKVLTFAEWLEKGREIGEDYGFSLEELDEYEAHIRHIIALTETRPSAGG